LNCWTKSEKVLAVRVIIPGDHQPALKPIDKTQSGSVPAHIISCSPELPHLWLSQIQFGKPISAAAA